MDSAVDQLAVEDQLNQTLLSLLRAALAIGLVANSLSGVADILVESERHIGVAILRFALIGFVLALLVATYAPDAVHRAVRLTLLALAVGCLQIVGPRAMHGDLSTPVVLSIALTAAVSTAAPWGVSGQMAAIGVTGFTTIAVLALAAGSLSTAWNVYPAGAAGAAFAMSLYGAAICRRNSVRAVERDLALQRSARTLEAREAQIRDQLIQLDTLYRTAPVGLALLDRDLRYLRINETLAELNGIPVEAHIGRTPADVIPQLASEIEPLLRRILATGEPVLEREVSGATAGQPGVTRSWRAGLWPVPDARGVVVAVSCVIQEVTEQKRAHQAVAQLNADLEMRVRERTAQLEAANQRLEHEIAERQQAAEALRRSRQQLQDILDNTTAVIYAKDTEGRYLLINSQYETLFHVSRTQVVGKTDYDLFPRETADTVRRNDRQVLDVDRPLMFEESVPQDDGMHTYISVKFPLRDEQGVGYGTCGISTDISDRKQMETQLQISQAQLSALIENTTDAIWSIDRTQRLIIINSVATQWFRQAYGAPLRDTDPLERRAPEAEVAVWRPLYDRALAGERLVLEREYPIDGSPHSYLIAVTPIVNDGGVTGATVFAKDITDLKHAEERAREHQAALSHMLRVHTIGEMAAGLAHEINQPLGAIANYAQGCRRRVAAGDAPAAELLPVLEEITAQALRAGEIIRRLRHMVEKGFPLRESTDLNHVVAEAVHVVKGQAAQQDVALNVELAPELPRVDVDPIQVEQVMVNLMINGLEAMRAIPDISHQLSVHTARDADGGVEVTVRDTGSGISEAVADKIFEPFFTSKPTGLGLGLAISRSIVEAHGGRLWAYNNPDGGATLHLSLPIRSPTR